MMRIYGTASVSEFLGENLIYRNMVPVDARLPSLENLRESAGLAPGITPRKSTLEYAQVISNILKAAKKLDTSGTPIERLIFVGDTLLNDSTAFNNICRAGNWPGLAFIGAEKDAPLQINIDEVDAGAVMHTNRWAALGQFQTFCDQRGFSIDRKTVVLLDLDKTTLGARGRNDRVIDQVRVEAAIDTVSGVLDDRFDYNAFQTTYDTFNQPRFHAFTTDNQDYLVYVCLVVGTGLYKQSELEKNLEDSVYPDFDAFLEGVEQRSGNLTPKIIELHQDFYRRVKLGDPTPFKAFRRAEYLATAARMGKLGTGTPVEVVLTQEIVITHEVRELMLTWREQGALLFGLSDKPDEASFPSPEMESKGYQPIHRIEACVVGESLG
jgi:hypothetical protein